VRDEDLRQTYQYELKKYKRKPTPEQARQLEEVVWRCRMLYNTALEERITASRRCGAPITCSQRQAESPDLKAAFPEYGTIHSQVLQDVLTRLDKTYQAFFRRMKAGQIPGSPRFQGRHRYPAFTSKQYGKGAQLDNGLLVLSKIRRIAVRWSRPIAGTPKAVTIAREADGWYAILSCADVPAQPLPLTGQETSIDGGLTVFLITADGLTVENPRHYRRGEKQLAKANKRVSRRKQGSQRRGKAVQQLGRAQQRVKRPRADFHHQTALAWLQLYDTRSRDAVRVANIGRNRRLAKRIGEAGEAAFRTILDGQGGMRRPSGDRGSACRHQPGPARTSQDQPGLERLWGGGPNSWRVRTHVCPACGWVLDRDANAARNSHAAGSHWARQALWGLAG
jgi:putative transposase